MTNVVITDVLDPIIIRPFNVLFPLPANVSITGNTMTTTPFSLSPGETGSFTVVFEVKGNGSLGKVINNTATLTAAQLGGPATSNTVTSLRGSRRPGPPCSLSW